ncbi:MAG: NAD-dependent deacylase [Acidobacteria bacterium]|nr:NAD-dependent deacylase [Acidobacteriota bacterium]
MHELSRDPQSTLAEVIRLLWERGEAVALTGAGISAESGIPTFRDKGGLWDTYDPTVYASIEVYRRDPTLYWTIRGDFIRHYDQYQPNPGHLALADLESLGVLRRVITQNIDGLHTKAGSPDVIELHGSIREIFCLSCGRQYQAPHVPPGLPPRCESCNGVLKPNTVLFGESLPVDALRQAQEEASTRAMMLVIGTSVNVYPAAALPEIARRHGAVIVEVNPERAFPLVDFWLPGQAGTVLPRLAEGVRKLAARGN